MFTRRSPSALKQLISGWGPIGSSLIQTKRKFCDVRPALVSITNFSTADRRLLSQPGVVCSRCEHLYRLRVVDEDACVTNSIMVLCRSASTTTDFSRSVPPTAMLQMLQVALVHCRLDYDNAMLVDLPASLHASSSVAVESRLIHRLV